MTESKIDSFNIEPLVFEIENVIKNGLKVILKDYIERHDLLEKTHKQIMKLPSVMNEINKSCDSDDHDSVEDKPIFFSISDMTRDLVKKEISYVEDKLDRIEKKYESISPLISKILDKLESINDEVKVLKENPRDNIKIVQMEHEKPYISNIIKPSIVSACENENIKFEINEDNCEESDEEEDVNPHFITCSTITLTKSEPIEIKKEKDDTDSEEEDEVEVVKPVKVKKEVIVIEEDEEEDENEDEDEDEDEDEEEEEEEDEDEDEDETEELSVGEELGEHIETVKESKEEEVDVQEADEEDEVETEASDEEEEEKVEPTPAPTKVEEEEEEELEIITIDDVDYCTNDVENGFIWELNEDGEQGDKIGYLKEGEPFFYADEN